jgi:hypothetical protein
VRKELTTLWAESTVQLFSSLKAEGIDEAAKVLSRLAAAKKQSPA